MCVCVCVCVYVHTCRHSVMSDSFDPMDCRPPGSSAHGIFQARILEWGATSSSRGSSRPGIKPASPSLAGEFFATSAPLPGRGSPPTRVVAVAVQSLLLSDSF